MFEEYKVEEAREQVKTYDWQELQVEYASWCIKYNNNPSKYINKSYKSVLSNEILRRKRLANG